jgi:hypothetical protein
VAGGWSRLHNEEFMTSTLHQVMKLRGMRWAGHVTRIGKMGNVCNILNGKPERKRPLGGPRRKWFLGK